MRPATLTGWRVAALQDRDYPGLVPAAGTDVAAGQVLDLTADERRTIDAFEDDSYTLDNITLDDGVPALAYVWADAATVLGDAWDADTFEADRLISYATRSAAWRLNYESTLPSPSV